MDLYRIRPMMIITIFVVGIGSSPAYVWAQEIGHPEAQSPFIQQFDQDGDGQLSASEFPGPADRFDQLDSDGDGLLSVEELRAARPGPPPGGRFEQDDADRDGLVSQAEFSGPEGLFERLDTDGDGYISPEEARPD